MDKKNTMLLTVIAVATLLVAVVGATFAYFSIVQGGDGETTTNFNGQVEDTKNYGTAQLNQKIASLKLNLTAADMAETLKGTQYWASESSEKEEERKYHVISQAEVKSQSQDLNAELTCTSTVTVKATSTTETQKAAIVAGDGKVYISAPQENSTNPVTVTTADAIDLKDLIDADTTGITKQIKYVITGNGTADLTADVELDNTSNNQNAIAGLNLTITFENTGFTCDVTNTGAGA